MFPSVHNAFVNNISRMRLRAQNDAAITPSRPFGRFGRVPSSIGSYDVHPCAFTLSAMDRPTPVRDESVRFYLRRFLID